MTLFNVSILRPDHSAFVMLCETLLAPALMTS